MQDERAGNVLDGSTKQYIKSVKWLQLLVLLVTIMAFILFGHAVIVSNEENFKEIALAEVKESMRETVSNIAMHIDEVKLRMEVQAASDVAAWKELLINTGVKNAEDLSVFLNTVNKKELKPAVEAIYINSSGQIYYVNFYEQTITEIKEKEEEIYKNTSVCESFSLEGQEIVLFVKEAEIDKFVKNEMHTYLHAQIYEGNQYVWVNEVLNMEGGENYAVRTIHPNLVDSEGEYLSTDMQDVKGNYPYQSELEGIRETGSIFHSYYFKNKTNNEVMEKYSYAQYYEPFHWIIATGETLEEVYSYSGEINIRSFRLIFTLLAVFVVLFGIIFGLMIRVLGKQSERFRKTLLKQSEVFENIYTTLSVGLLRISFTSLHTTILQINPKALETLGIKTLEECNSKIHGHKFETMLPKDAQRLEDTCKALSEQWESVVTECHVEWKDGSLRLLQIRDTLVDFDGDTKIIQRMCQDITEERFQHEKALREAEEKATLDPMTQIKNKRAIETIIREHIMEAAEKLEPIAIGFVDIDNFREYNTKYGHMQGDEVIKYVANTIKEEVPGIVGRNGGDEFAFVIPNASYEIVEVSMKEIHKKLNIGVQIKETGEQIATPCSIGVIIEKSSALDYDYVMEKSDAAMYEAKARGKNTYHILTNMP